MKIFSSKSALFASAMLLALSSVSPLHAQGKPGWIDDQTKALAQAKTDKKLVLMDFTGSDWCGWCMKMDKEVFDTPEFKDYAKDHLVLLELDYPHKKELAAQTKAQNDKLAKQYGVEGFPTLIVVDADGKQVKSFDGYQAGGAKAFIAELEKLKS